MTFGKRATAWAIACVVVRLISAPTPFAQGPKILP